MFMSLLLPSLHNIHDFKGGQTQTSCALILVSQSISIWYVLYIAIWLMNPKSESLNQILTINIELEGRQSLDQ